MLIFLLELQDWSYDNSSETRTPLPLQRRSVHYKISYSFQSSLPIWKPIWNHVLTFSECVITEGWIGRRFLRTNSINLPSSCTDNNHLFVLRILSMTTICIQRLRVVVAELKKRTYFLPPTIYHLLPRIHSSSTYGVEYLLVVITGSYSSVYSE